MLLKLCHYNLVKVEVLKNTSVGLESLIFYEFSVADDHLTLRIVDKSATANVRRFADSKFCHGPNSWLGWRKWNSFLIRGARDFTWLRHPTASLVFNIGS